MYHCDRFELAIACRRKLSVSGRNEGKLCADRILNDNRRGKMNGIKRSDVVVFDYLFCLGQDLRHGSTSRQKNDLVSRGKEWLCKLVW